MSKASVLDRLIEAEYSVLQIANMSKDEMFSALLTWEGFIGYENWIKNLIEDVYDIEVE